MFDSSLSNHHKPRAWRSNTASITRVCMHSSLPRTATAPLIPVLTASYRDPLTPCPRRGYQYMPRLGYAQEPRKPRQDSQIQHLSWAFEDRIWHSCGAFDGGSAGLVRSDSLDGRPWLAALRNASSEAP